MQAAWTVYLAVDLTDERKVALKVRCRARRRAHFLMVGNGVQPRGELVIVDNWMTELAPNGRFS